MFDEEYADQVRLLLRCIPEIEKHKCFALKGGSAINLFLRDMPRLSVDIDLTFLPLSSRDKALGTISDTLLQIRRDITLRVPGASVQEQIRDEKVAKLIVSDSDAVIKIEPNPVIRGSVFPAVNRSVHQRVEDIFEMFASMQTLEPEELYAGKICAALDRQHPRDLFDITLLLDDEGGITAKLASVFAVYLASHRRPMNELLNPRFHDISDAYDSSFRGMSRLSVSLDELKDVQFKLPNLIVDSMSNNDREFLISIKEARPDWSLLPFSNTQDLPAIKWKLRNIRRMSADKHREYLDKLRKVLGV